MTVLSRGTVILVPFPFPDLSGLKRRPALVVSSDSYNRSSPDVLIAQITSRLSTPPRPGDHRIEQWKDAGLLVPSLLRARLTTLEMSQVLRVLGTLPSEEMQAVDSALAEALGLAC